METLKIFKGKRCITVLRMKISELDKKKCNKEFLLNHSDDTEEFVKCNTLGQIECCGNEKYYHLYDIDKCGLGAAQPKGIVDVGTFGSPIQYKMLKYINEKIIDIDSNKAHSISLFINSLNKLCKKLQLINDSSLFYLVLTSIRKECYTKISNWKGEYDVKFLSYLKNFVCAKLRNVEQNKRYSKAEIIAATMISLFEKNINEKIVIINLDLNMVQTCKNLYNVDIDEGKIRIINRERYVLDCADE